MFYETDEIEKGFFVCNFNVNFKCNLLGEMCSSDWSLDGCDKISPLINKNVLILTACHYTVDLCSVKLIPLITIKTGLVYLLYHADL